MKLDKAQNFDNFVDWVKEKDPDFMALCECNAFTEESLTALAGRYGHPYAILCKESGFPVGLTSKYPIELRNRLLEDVPLWHGAIHTRIKDINVVVLHLYPFGTYPNGQGAAGTGNTYRDREINCILDSTIPVSYTHLDVYKRQVQGFPKYTKDYEGNFDWLKYGSAEPLETRGETPIDSWTADQKKMGLESTPAQEGGTAYCLSLIHISICNNFSGDNNA